MPKRQLTLPDYYSLGIKNLIDLDEPQATALIKALDAEQPIYYHPRALTAHLGSLVAIDRSILDAVVDEDLYSSA